MSARQTKFPIKKVPARSVHQAAVIVGKNGLPVDALATLEPGTTLVSGGPSFTYSAPTATFPASVNLSSLVDYSLADAKHTGILMLTDKDSGSFFIDPSSINDTTKTLNLYSDENFTQPATDVKTAVGWIISEAELVNRLQTTNAAVVDSVEFRDVQVQLDLNGDKVKITDDDGDVLAINPDGSLNMSQIEAVDDTAEAVHTFNEIVNLAKDTPSTITSYTAPVNKITFLQRITVAGTNIADYRIKLNGTVIEKTYTYFSGPLKDKFEFIGGKDKSGLELSPGDIILVEVEHSRPQVGNFNSRIQVLEVDV